MLEFKKTTRRRYRDSMCNASVPPCTNAADRALAEAPIGVLAPASSCRSSALLRLLLHTRNGATGQRSPLTRFDPGMLQHLPAAPIANSIRNVLQLLGTSNAPRIAAKARRRKRGV